MAKRMQVLVEEREYARLQKAARRRGLTLAEWVRQVLRAACREVPTGTPERKLAAVRRGAQHGFPTADIDELLAQIERGYTADPNS